MNIDLLLSGNDRALVDEAVRRVVTGRSHAAADHGTVHAAVSQALQAGRRDLFGLVKAGQRAR